LSVVARVSMLGRLREAVAALGWRDVLWLVAARLIERASFGSGRLIKYYFVAQPVPIAPLPVRASGSIRLYLAHRADDVLARAPRPAGVIADRFGQGACCVVAERDGEPVGFLWWCPGQYREDQVRCRYRWEPASAAVWDFDVFVVPSLRVGRLFARLWLAAHTQLRGEQVAWTLSRIDAFNAASLGAHRRLGARELGRGVFLSLGPVQLSLLSMAPFAHLSFSGRRVPELCFDLSRLNGSEST
jgi:hypothetical protein